MKVEINRIEPSDKAWLAQVALESERTLLECLRLSAFAWTGSVDGELACVLGMVPPSLMSNQAYIWLHTTEVAERHQFLLVRYSQIMIEKMHEKFEILVGHCEIKAHRSRRWLRWLGADFGSPNGVGIPFVIRKK